MPEDKARKRAVRDRMAQTGERYTTAARKLGAPAQGEQPDKTLTEQGEQLDKTLKAQSERLDRTFAEQRTRTLNERFDTVAGQLGSDKPPAVRVAGVYAMAGLADDWQDHRQMCVDVLCAYLRMPYEPGPGDDAPVERRLAWKASREVRHTVIRVIATHLNGTAAVSWCGLNFDFAGAVFDGGDFSGARFSGGPVNFSSAKFSGAAVNFSRSKFTGEGPEFTGAGTSGGTVFFHAAEFSGGTVSFSRAEFSSETVDFTGAGFSGGTVDFSDAGFCGGMVGFAGAGFCGGTVDFSRVASWTQPPDFGSGFDMSHPPAGLMLPAATSPSPDSPVP